MRSLGEVIRGLFGARSERVLPALLRAMSFNLLAKAFAYSRYLAIAVLIGFTAGTDAFFMALGLLGIFMIFVDMFDSLGVPNLVRARMEGEERFERLSKLLFSFTVILSLVITSLGVVLAPFVIRIAVGFEEGRAGKALLYLYLLLPYLFFSFYFHHFSAVLRSVRRFTPFFVGNFLLAFLIFLIVSIGLFLYRDPLVLPIAFSTAQVVSTLYVVYVAREHMGFSWYMDNRVKEMIKQGAFLIALYGVFHLIILVDKAFASLLPTKSLSALHFGYAVFYGFVSLVPVSNVVITPLSEVHGSLEKLNFYLKKLVLPLFLSTLLIFIFAPLIVKLLFGYGAFSHLDTELTATALRYYSLGLLGFVLWPIFYRVFQIRNQLMPVFLVAIFGVFVNFLANYLFVVAWDMGIKGIALGTVLAYATMCSVAYYLLRQGV